MKSMNCAACNKSISWGMFKNYGYCVNCQAIDDILKHGREQAEKFFKAKRNFGLNEAVVEANMKLPYWKKKFDN